MKQIDKSARVKEFRTKRTSRIGERFKKKTKPGQKKSFKILKYLLVLFFIISIYFLILFSTKYWDGEGKLSIVISTPERSVSIVTFDPKRQEVSQVNIPADTQVEVARGRGVWKIKSVWKLGEEEGVGGLLLAETLTNQMKIPVYIWAEALAEGLSAKDFLKVIKAVFSPYKTNMGVGDRIRIALFNISIKNIERKNINLEETIYLRAGELADGSSGYIVTGKYPSELLSIFSDEEISQKSLKVEISDYSGNSDVATGLGGVVEILGAKVAAIKSGETQKFDCEVSGDELMVEKIVSLFGCIEANEEVRVFDVSLKIGETFAKRF